MRIRDIVHDSGRRLRIGLDRSGGEFMLIHLSDPACPSEPVQLDLYGGELLAGFLMSARLAGGSGLGEERSGGLFGCRLRLVGNASIELVQDRSRLHLPQILWDRLYAELLLALAHGRHLGGCNLIAQDPLRQARPRLLH